jgi:uncharacterized membrane protein
LFGSLALGGSSVVLSEVAPWTLVRLLGWSLASGSGLFVLTMLCSRFLAGPISTWRRNRSMKRRQAELARSSRAG